MCFIQFHKFVHTPKLEFDEYVELPLFQGPLLLLLGRVESGPALELLGVQVDLLQQLVHEGLVGQVLVLQFLFAQVVEQCLRRGLHGGQLQTLNALQFLSVFLLFFLIRRVLVHQQKVVHWIYFLFFSFHIFFLSLFYIFHSVFLMDFGFEVI